MANNQEEETNFVLSFSKVLRVSTMTVFEITGSHVLVLHCFTNFDQDLDEIEIKLLGDGYTVKEDNEN